MLEFEVYEVVGFEGDEDATILFSEKDNHSGGRFTSDIAIAERFADGEVRFDGCANVMFDECQNNVMLHGCSREDMTRIGNLFDVLYDIAIEAMPEHRDYLERRRTKETA